MALRERLAAPEAQGQDDHAEAGPVPACDATMGLSRGFTAFPVHGKAPPAYKENDGMHDTKCSQP